VLSDAKEIAAAVKELSPESLVILDGVCSVGSEEIRFDEWGIDSQSELRYLKLA
jgi:alanine-glyoxylate transaminase/serine-glyoxylate transaminase/serine-pyruvate transaminase